MFPALPPFYVQSAVDQSIINAASFEVGEGGVWKHEWSRWHSLDLEPFANTWFGELMLPEEQRMPGAVQGLVGHLWEMRELLHYAQREQILRWFPHYDPSSPDQLEDTDRPWDYDHIFPETYGHVNSLPRLIRESFTSIGNLRVWPLEANRAVGADCPAKKLNEPISQERADPYSLLDGAQIRFASQIAEDDWKLWKATTPNRDAFPHNFLAKSNGDQLCRPNFVRAVSSRWIKLYSEWHTELRIGRLFEAVA